jgi:hypothetical protein
MPANLSSLDQLISNNIDQFYGYVSLDDMDLLYSSDQSTYPVKQSSPDQSIYSNEHSSPEQNAYFDTQQNPIKQSPDPHYHDVPERQIYNNWPALVDQSVQYQIGKYF